MYKPLTKQVALITGGARGIGRQTALKLAAAGCDVIINYFNSSDEADSVCKECEALGVRALAIQANVSDEQSLKSMFATIREFTPKLNIVISNAASGVLKPAMEMKLKHWRWCMETNAFPLVLLAQQAVDMMPAGSRMIALSSLGAGRAIPNYAFIGASKAALESMVRGLSLELAPKHISVNCISAGVVDTDALKHFPNREQLLDEYQTHSLAGRPLLAEDVANSVYLLCLPEAEMIKGQTLFVDAGYSIIG